MRGDDHAVARPRRSPSVRTKVLAVVVLLAGLGMAVAEVTSYVVSARRLDVRLDAAIAQEVAEFRTLAEQGVNPRTGRPFEDIDDLLRTALARNVADSNETFLGLGSAPYVPADPGVVDLLDEPALLAAVTAQGPASRVELAEVESAVGTLRYAAVPVVLPGAPDTGTYVVAYAVDLERRDLVSVARTYAYVATGSLLLLAVGGWLILGRLLRPLALLREAAASASPQRAERIPERGNDDVTDLTRSFNTMLDRLQDAFAQQRQFIADAGHELRTPVTIVRGHLELLDPGDPRDVAETRALVLDEVDRMGRLVDDLVVLARAQRPDLVDLRPVDLDRLVEEVLVKARALGDRDWRLDAAAVGVVQADEQRLQQALLQLADNAVKHTPAGTTVAVGARRDDDAVRLWVRDTGPGIAVADRARVLQRFGRADHGRGVEGSGLGLAIVGAIAEAHGGRLEVDDAPGGGALLTLVLPPQPARGGTAAREEPS